MSKVLKIVLTSIVSLVIVLYGGVFLGHKMLVKEEPPTAPTPVTIKSLTNGRFTFGPQAHPAPPTTLKGFLPILAKQLATYNKVAPDLWPGNTLLNQTLVVEDLTHETFWLIKPDGAFAEVTEKDVNHYGFERLAYPNGFSFFKGGMYLAIDEEDIKNPSIWEKYLHVGTFDSIIWVIHEGFHETQRPWADTTLKNGDRDDHLENIPARLQRALLQKQLFNAVSHPGDTDAILAALATYQDWKTRFASDFEESVLANRYEGTAQYFEIVASLLASYPDQVKNLDDVDTAVSLLATREEAYAGHGLVVEGYTVGGFSAFLLDRLEPDWKQRLMADPTATPIEMLYQHFKDHKLPSPIQLSQAETEAITQEIAARGQELTSINGDDLPQINDTTTQAKESTLTKVVNYLYDHLYWWLPAK